MISLHKNKIVVFIAPCTDHEHVDMFSVHCRELGKPVRYNSPQIVRFIIHMNNRGWRTKEK